jgi:HD-GYP domain-containing protein (c-di-GMP phosphodiesterase class II)
MHPDVPAAVTGGMPVTRRLQDQGRRILTSFYAAMRALKFYPPENVAVQQAVDELHRLVNEVLSEEGGVELRVVGEFFFLNETRLRLDLTNYSTFGSFARVLADHGLGAVDITAGVDRAEWTPFLSLLLRTPMEENRFSDFVARMSKTPVRHIHVIEEQEAQKLDLEAEEALAAAKRTYVQSVRAAEDVLGDVRMGRAVNVRKVKRAVQSIVDQVLGNEPSLMAMTTLRDFDEYTFTHSVNVCIFSVVIGQRLGLTKSQLYDLGLGALFHDVGKMRLDPDVINKVGRLTAEEWRHIQDHPADGLLALFQLQGFVDVPYRQMLIAYEHHMKVDQTGYPRSTRPRNTGLFSRIVAVADGFDAGTSVRSYQYKPWAPGDVLKEMRDNPKRGFDPLLVKALINATGVYPVGTLVVLDTHELAVVASANPDPERLHQPIVKIISDASGMPHPEPPTVDLSEVDPATGALRRSIIKTTEAEKYGVRVSDYIT